MEIQKRKTIFSELSKFKPLYEVNPNDFIEITEWTNGEGWDVHIEQKGRTERFQLHYDDLNIINYLIRHMDYNEAK